MFEVDVINNESKERLEILNAFKDLKAEGFVDVPKEVRTEEEFIQWMIT